MSPAKVKFKIGIAVIIFLMSGCNKPEPENILVIKTEDIEIFSEGVYTFKGTILSIGKEEINDHGFYWSVSNNPEMNGTSIRLGPITSTGSYISTEYDLLPATTYYVKAFAITSSNSYYGEEKSFRTPETLVHPVKDIDNNLYYPVKIGDQTWLNENLKVTHYPDGSAIERIEERQIWFDMPWYNSAYCWYDNFGNIAGTYGNLYTWPAAVKFNSKGDVKTGNIQGVCPDGWHLPSDDEWKQLELFLGLSQAEIDIEGWRGEDEGDKLKYEGKQLWVGPNTRPTNESGFAAIPAGFRDGAGWFRNIGKSTKFWSTSRRGDYAWIRQLDYNSPQIFRGTTGVYEGISVRCIKDLSENK
jgi:uncharacterized protein (TIGR02145 family)